MMAAKEHALQIQQYESAAELIRTNPKLNSGQRKHQLRQLRPNQKWLTNTSVVVGVDISLLRVAEWKAARDIDLAAGRVEPFDPSWFPIYPVFKNPSNLRQGTSLCRLGYPFLPVVCTFDPAANKFALGCPQLAFFPNEGIYTREILAGPSQHHKQSEIRFIETSSAGLRGQSGGPLFDQNGIVWGIQSTTQSFDLGFNPNLKLTSGKEVEVHQFMNVGWAVHPKTIHEFLTAEGVSFEMER
jgi:hypothetical protein